MTIVYTRRGVTPDYSMDTAPDPSISLYEMAEILLNRTRQSFESQGVLLPTRQIIYPSPIPVDCEQLAVLMAGWVPQPPWEGVVSCQAVKWCGAFTIVLSRVTPAMPKSANRAPGAEQMNSAARIASEDSGCLLDVARGLGEIGPDFSLETGSPQGGFQTCAMNIQVPAFGGLE